jgi:MscS family membrane protein
MRRLGCLTLGALLITNPVQGQGLGSFVPKSAAPEPASSTTKDPLGRDTPRGTVLGFIDAAVASRLETTPLYLNTNLRGQEASELARMLFVVLDRRLPARLNTLSDRPDGAPTDLLEPNQDLVGSVSSRSGMVDILVERVDRGASGPVWLFSRRTLDSIPVVYAEIDFLSFDRVLPAFLKRTIFGVRLLAWLMLAFSVPIAYQLVGVLDRLLRPLVVAWRRRRGKTGGTPAHILPGALRLFIIAIGIRWLLSVLELPLIERQFWSVIATLFTIGAAVWAMLLVTARLEQTMYVRAQAGGRGEAIAMIRLLHRVADVLVVAAGGLVVLSYFGVDPTAVLAGLGIGGIAVALAAQKTLENVIGGLSIIVDKAVVVGDTLKVGELTGTVESVGLRSTRIRTLDRTIVSVPNGQISTATIETLSARDKFWFHHIAGLRYETTATQMRAVIDGIRTFLTQHPAVDSKEAIRVRLLKLSPSSLDVEIFAYVVVTNWEAFLETQESMLIAVMEIIEQSGAELALPTQTVQWKRAKGAP